MHPERRIPTHHRRLIRWCWLTAGLVLLLYRPGTFEPYPQVNWNPHGETIDACSVIIQPALEDALELKEPLSPRIEKITEPDYARWVTPTMYRVMCTYDLQTPCVTAPSLPPIAAISLAISGTRAPSIAKRRFELFQYEAWNDRSYTEKRMITTEISSLRSCI
jgi:hypothetical protein